MKSFLSSSSVFPPFLSSVLRSPTSVLRPLSSVLRPLSSVLRPLSSVLRPLSSVLRPLSSVLRPPSSVLRPLSSIFLLLLTLSASAQENLFITVSAPLSNKTASTKEVDVFKTVSSPAIQPAASVQSKVVAQPVAVVQPVVKPADQPVSRVEKPVAEVVPVVPAKESAKELEQELLRDPFWPIGFFPEDWQKKSTKNDANMDGQDWKAAAAKISIDGTSRMGDKMLAIINGELKNVGDLVVVIYKGKTYQWKIFGIDSSGKVQLQKQETR